MAIIKRGTKGSALTHAELDGNFTELDGRTTTIAEAHNPVLTFDKNKYTDTAISQSGAIAYSLAASGHIDGVVIRHKILSDGVNPITFSADFNVFGKSANDIYPSGLHIFYFNYVGGDVDVSIPTYNGEAVTAPTPNTAPSATADSFSVDQNGTLNGNVLNNDTDADGDSLTAILVSNVSNGTLDLNSDGSFAYTPTTDYTGADSFSYKVNDGTEDGNTVTVSITVNAAVPSFEYVTYEANSGVTLEGNGTVSRTNTSGLAYKVGATATKAINGDNSVLFTRDATESNNSCLGLTNTYSAFGDGLNMDIVVIFDNMTADKPLAVYEHGASTFSLNNGWAANDVVELKVVGTTISLLKNGATLFTSAQTFVKPLTPVIVFHGDGNPRIINSRFADPSNLVTSPI